MPETGKLLPVPTDVAMARRPFLICSTMLASPLLLGTAGLNANFTVRRVSYGEGVERVFPLHSPRIAKIEIERQGSVRRSKLNFLRDRKGKSATTVKEKAERA